MRPSLGFRRFGEIFGVSQWMLLFNIGRYLRVKLHQILVGRWEVASVLGAYTLADDISRLPASELLSPINRALFPSFAKVKESAEKLKEQYLLAQGVQTLVAIPAAAGLALVAGEAVPLLLGEQWYSAIPFVQILALINIAQALTTSGMYVLLAIGHTRINALFVWSQVVLFAALAMSPVIERTAMDVAWLSLAVAAVALWLQFWLLIRKLPVLGFREIAAVSLRPLLAAGLMALAIENLPLPDGTGLVIALAAKVLVGVTVYLCCVAILWIVSGKPAGAETYIAEKTRGIWRPALARLQGL
jgi:O-antigen/teichoic acid export membrane protein